MEKKGLVGVRTGVYTGARVRAGAVDGVHSGLGLDRARMCPCA